MGIYLINSVTLKRLLEEHFPEANDFKSEVIPGAISLGLKVLLIINIYTDCITCDMIIYSLCCFSVKVTCTKILLSFGVRFKLVHLMDTGRT